MMAIFITFESAFLRDVVVIHLCVNVRSRATVYVFVLLTKAPASRMTQLAAEGIISTALVA